MTQSTPELLPVIQADRDAAAKRLDRSLASGTIEMLRDGKLDHHAWVQAFARHRIEHSTPDRNAVLEAALLIADHMNERLYNGRTGERPAEIDRALRVLKTTTPEPTDPAGVSEMADEALKLSACIWRRGNEWVLELSGEANDRAFVSRHAEPISTPLEDVAGLPSLYRTPDPVLEVAKEALERIADDQFGVKFKDLPAVSLMRRDIARAALQTINERSNHEG